MTLTVKIPDEETSEFSGDEGEKYSSDKLDIEHDKNTLSEDESETSCEKYSSENLDIEHDKNTLSEKEISDVKKITISLPTESIDLNYGSNAIYNQNNSANVKFIDLLDFAFAYEKNISCEIEEVLVHVEKEFAGTIYNDICNIVFNYLDGGKVSSRYIKNATNKTAPSFIKKYIHMGKFMGKCHEASELSIEERQTVWTDRLNKQNEAIERQKEESVNMNIHIQKRNDCKKINKFIYKCLKRKITTIDTDWKRIIKCNTKTLIRQSKMFWIQLSIKKFNSYVQRAVIHKILKVKNKAGRACIPKTVEDMCNLHLGGMIDENISKKKVIYDYLYSKMF